jgi:hypothetical protein
MPILTKGVYGYETDAKKTPFGFLNNQTRLDGVINSAGWFNALGERLGCGDLSIKDMYKISQNIPTGEMFAVLSELNASWDIPSELDRSAPGYDYIIQNAAWIICKTTKGGIIIRVRGDEFPVEDGLRDGVKYLKLPRKDFFAAIKYSIPKKNDLSTRIADAAAHAKAKTTYASAVKSSNVSPAPAGSLQKTITKAVASTLPTKTVPASTSTVKSSTVKKVGGYYTSTTKKP